MNGLDSLAQRARRGERLEDVLIIDAHGHLGRWYGFPSAESDADSVIKVLDYIGIDCLCVSGHVSAVGTDFVYGNDLCIDAVKRYPGRFLGYITVYPNHPEGVLKEIERCEAFGLKALKLHSFHGKPYTAPEYHPAYERASEKGYPILAHTWGAELEAIRELAQLYPTVSWLVAHAGAVQEEDYIKIAREIDNVYLEICTSVSFNRQVERFVKAVGAAKVLYGSDEGFISATQQIGRVVLARISEDEKRQILGLNAKRIFGL